MRGRRGNRASGPSECRRYKKRLYSFFLILSVMLFCFLRAANIRRSILCFSTASISQPIFFLLCYSIDSPQAEAIISAAFWVFIFFYFFVLLFPPSSQGRIRLILFLISLRIELFSGGSLIWGLRGKDQICYLRLGPCIGT